MMIASKDIVCLMIMLVNNISWSCRANFSKVWHFFHFFIASIIVCANYPLQISEEDREMKLGY